MAAGGEDARVGAMSTPRLRARTALVDPELARSTLVELPDRDAAPSVRSFAELIRSLVPASFRPPESEGVADLPVRAPAGRR